MPNFFDDDRVVCCFSYRSRANSSFSELFWSPYHRYFFCTFFCWFRFFINTLRNVYKIINKKYCTFYAFAYLSHDRVADESREGRSKCRRKGRQREIDQIIYIIENKSGKRKWKEREINKNNIAKMSPPPMPLSPSSQQLLTGAATCECYGTPAINRQNKYVLATATDIQLLTDIQSEHTYIQQYWTHIWCSTKITNKASE